MLDAAGSQEIQDTVEQPAGVTPGSADVLLRWREVFPDNLPEIIVDFPEGHVPEYYLRGLIIWEDLIIKVRARGTSEGRSSGLDCCNPGGIQQSP